MEQKLPAVYILASKRDGVLYTGVTSNLIKRIWQHQHGETGGFTAKYHVHRLVWYEHHDTMETAITREKQLKGRSRAKKVALVVAMNPDWKDLYPEIL